MRPIHNCNGYYIDSNGDIYSNKKGYEALKIHAQNCYQLILNNLVNQTHYWQDEQRNFELRKAAVFNKEV